MFLVLVALAPIFIILFYIYYRDKYEKEPIQILILSFIFGAAITLPLYYIEPCLQRFWNNNFFNNSWQIANIFYTAFFVAAFSEELFKFAVLYFFIWKNKNFNELFDGIVYAIFIAMGFAAVENILYVFTNGLETAVLRIFTAVPLHALLAINMGYFFALAKFSDKKKLYLALAFIVPLVLHGIYDFILMSENEILLLFFIPYIILIYIYAFIKIKKHSDNSVFKY